MVINNNGQLSTVPLGIEVRQELQRAQDGAYAVWQALSRAKVTGRLLTDSYQLYEDIRGTREQVEAEAVQNHEYRSDR